MTSGKKGSNPSRDFTCEYCERAFKRIVPPSRLKRSGQPRFCSPSCRNKARSLIKIPCPFCGQSFKPLIKGNNGSRRKFCSPKCSNEERLKIENAIATRYPSEGPKLLMQEFNLTRSAVQSIAYRRGARLEQALYRKRVHEAARQFMLANNPMKRPEVRAKVRAWWKTHPELAAEALCKSLEARSRNQCLSPSKLEIKLREILNSLKIKYEPSAIVKPKFVVDIRIGNLIIQADGDYWHGHPRFEPLTERQLAQKRRDSAQDVYLRTRGFAVIRIWESDMTAEFVASVLKEQGLL